MFGFPPRHPPATDEFGSLCWECKAYSWPEIPTAPIPCRCRMDHRAKTCDLCGFSVTLPEFGADCHG